MDRIARSALICVIGTCFTVDWHTSVAVGGEPTTNAGPRAFATKARAEHDRWLAQYTAKSLDGVKLAIVVVSGEDKARADVFPWDNIRTYCCSVSTTGAIGDAWHDNMGTKGSWGHSVPPTEFKRLCELVAKLPDDGSRLPPVGRRLIVEAATGAKVTARVYDRANMPDEILEVVRLSECMVGAWTPEFSPQSEIETGSRWRDAYLCMSADQSQIVYGAQRWDPTTHEFLGAMGVGNGVTDFGSEASAQKPRRPAAVAGTGFIAFSPDASLAAYCFAGECALSDNVKCKVLRKFEEPWIAKRLELTRRNSLSSPRFTPDGKYLLLECTESSLRIFDVRTGERVARLADVPEESVQFIPALRKRCAVVRTKDGAISLWDLDRHAPTAKFDKGGYVTQAAFAPDESLVALVTADKAEGAGRYVGKPRLRLWNVDTGEFVRELWPFELPGSAIITCVVWSRDSRYLFAANGSSRSQENISVWNVSTGRHRGQFVGCRDQVNGIVLLPDGGELVAGCSDGRIHFWDFSAAMKRIHDFENSFSSR